MHVADDRGVLERVEEDGRGDVVGQVAGQADRVAGGELGEVHFEHVAVHDGEAFAQRAQVFQQVAVELDDGEFAVQLQQRDGDGAGAGADLDEAVAGLGIDGAHDFADDAGLVQEVLAELLLVAVGLHRRIVGGRVGFDRLTPNGCRTSPVRGEPVESHA